MARKLLMIIAVLALAGAAARFLARRYLPPDAPRNMYCKVANTLGGPLRCSIARELESVCTLYAEAEFRDFEGAEGPLGWIRDNLETLALSPYTHEMVAAGERRPLAERYRFYLSVAVEEGDEAWRCPPMERLFEAGTSTTAR